MPQLTFRKYLVLAGITVFSTAGDSLLARGMKGLGGASLHHLSGLLLAVLSPSVTVGIILLLAFFACYMSALSWADLTYVLPLPRSHMCSSPWLGISVFMNKFRPRAGWALR